MNPEDTKPVNESPATAPEVNPPATDVSQQNVPLVDTTVQLPADSSSSAPTMADTLSPDQPEVSAQAQSAAPADAPAASGVVNATSPITDTAPTQPTAEDPGHTMGIIGLVLAVVVPFAGLIVSILARSKSKKAGHKNGLALAGIIVSIVSMLVSIAIAAAILMAVNKTVQFCNENGAGTHTTEDGVTITCN